ncbi:HNH endonuclease [Halomonas sp. ATCH28]|uniref:HNH endonuclease n=1 Tax=Halomonas gemina TaxID=2945105 RepID=A0ABT0T0P5_9GAMM|nr:HNH endonuclease [Halomonas gemina]MCL7940443.1 HNH endonuclease [Halomonas gemina]
MLNNDEKIRKAAFSRLNNIVKEHGHDLPWRAISKPVPLGDDSFLLANQVKGIFKPRQLRRGVLSIKTVIQKSGSSIYSDSVSDEGGFWYAFRRGGLDEKDNLDLISSYKNKDPIIYFLGLAPGRYFPLWPCYIDSVDTVREMCHISMHDQIGVMDNVAEPTAGYQVEDLERRHIIREVKTRVHQAEFRARVMNAYSNRCAMTGLPVPQLLEAAHIIPDSHEESPTEVSNGISLSRLHHRAYDAGLIGIDPDYRLHLRDELITPQGGPLLESIKKLDGQRLKVPRNPKNKPDRDALAIRFEEFLNA